MNLKKIIEANNNAISENLNCEWLCFNNGKYDKLSFKDLGNIITYSYLRKRSVPHKERKQFEQLAEKKMFKMFFLHFYLKKLFFLLFVYSLLLVSAVFSIIYLCKMYMNYGNHNKLWFYIVPWCFFILNITLLLFKLYYTGLVKYNRFINHLFFIYLLSECFILLIQALSLVKNTEFSFIICFVFWVFFSYLLSACLIHEIQVKNQRINHFIFNITFLEYEYKIKSIKFDRYLIKRYVVLCEFKEIFLFHFPLDNMKNSKELKKECKEKIFVNINNEIAFLEKKYKQWLENLSH